MKNKIKKYIASLFTTILFGIYFTYRSVFSGGEDMVALDKPVPPAPKTISVPKTVVAVKPAPVPTPPVVTPPKVASGYMDGTYVGNSVDAFYGNVQVQITVQGGVITNSVAIDSPDNRSQSVRINSRAIPRLDSEVVSAQSSKIDAVSGATYTTAAYKKSLTSALSQARV